MSSNNRNREVSYDEAMQNLLAMFPHIEQTIIETILELNRGALEPTVEQLLTLDPANTGTTNNDHRTNETSSSSGTTTTTSNSSSGRPHQNVSPAKPPSRSNSLSPTMPVPSTSSTSSTSTSSSVPSSSTSSSSRWRHPLPDNFLMLPDEVLRLAETYGPRTSNTNTNAPSEGSRIDPRVRSNSGNNGTSSSSSLSHPKGNTVDTDAELAQMLQNELFIEQLRLDPEFAAYLRANPEVALSLGIPLGSIPIVKNSSSSSSSSPSNGPSAHIHNRSPQQPSPSSTGWDISKAMNNVSTDMRRRMEMLSARFRRNAAATSGTTNTTNSTKSSTPSKGIFSSLFDSRGTYSSIPQRNEEDERDALIGNGGLDGGGDGVMDSHAHSHHHGGGLGTTTTGSSNNRAERVKSMNTKSPYLSGTGSMNNPPIEIELGPRPSSVGGHPSSVSTKGSLNGTTTTTNNNLSHGMTSSLSSTAAMTFSIEDDEDEDESETKSLTNNKRALHV